MMTQILGKKPKARQFKEVTQPTSSTSSDTGTTDVEYYKDKQHRSPMWIIDCNNFFALQPTRFPTSELKIRYLISRMPHESRASRWTKIYLGLPPASQPAYLRN